MVRPLDNLLKYSNVILGSGSPRRKELLAGLGIDFIVRPLNADESYPENLKAEDVPQYISRKKAAAYIDTIENNLVITADTIVALNNRILGKPRNLDEARTMLCSLSGRTHQVVTGVTVLTKNREETFAAVSHVTMANFTDKEINYYVDNFKPLDKAGAYGIQEWIGMIGVTKLEGSYFNVMGLPVQRLYALLKTF